jgi:hypothetical protein
MHNMVGISLSWIFNVPIPVDTTAFCKSKERNKAIQQQMLLLTNPLQKASMQIHVASLNPMRCHHKHNSTRNMNAVFQSRRDRKHLLYSVDTLAYFINANKLKLFCHHINVFNE